jgi:hypothetical protein
MKGQIFFPPNGGSILFFADDLDRIDY